MLDVALEVPLALLAVRGLVQGHHAGGAGVEVLGETLDGPALARGVPTLEYDHVFEVVVLTPVLELQQFDLQLVLLELIVLAGHPLVVRVPLTPRLHRASTRVDQIGVRGLPVPHGVPLVHELVDELAQVLPGRFLLGGHNVLLVA